MSEKLNISKNSWNMKYIHSKNTKIEVILRKALWNAGFRYRKNYEKLPGKPDWEVLKPKLEKGNNPDFWIKKITRNQQRDEEVNKQLLFMGWTVIRFWGNEIKKNPEQCVKVVEETIFDLMMEEGE